VFVPSVAGVTLPTDVALARRLDAAYDYVKEQRWAEASHALQSLLDICEDVLVGVRRAGADGKESDHWIGIRTEAGRLLAHLPPRGRESYEAAHGPPAKSLLAEANRTGDVNLLGEVARRYFHTPAGAEATRLLGCYHLDRGRYHLAATCFGRLLDRAGGDRLPPSTLLAAVVAFRQAGDEARANQLWDRLALKAPSGVRRGGQLVSLSELEQGLLRFQAVSSVSSASHEHEFSPAPLLETRWTKPTASEDITREWLLAAVQREEDRSQLVLPSPLPIMVGEKIVYRSCRGIHAVDPATGKLAWESESEWGLDKMVRELRYHPYLAAWVNGYAGNNPNLLLANATLGTLSTDGARVYAVEDLPLPPYPISNSGGSARRRGPFFETDFGPDLTDVANYSRLFALDAGSGKLLWQAGGRGKDGGSELRDSYFLGPPLALDGGLYGVIERNQELRLVCLDAAGGELRWAQPLAMPADKLLRDVGRRVKPLRPAYAEGILVCPTNAGVVLGVDLFHRSLAWAYAYGEEVVPPEVEAGNWGRRGRYVPRELPRLREDWKATAPIIHADRVVLTAPDASAVHCLELRNGARVWKAERKEDDLYLAGVFNRKVLIVGKQGCRALALADGKLLWSVEAGLPSGRGVAAGGNYFLPLKSALPEKKPAVYAIGLERGTIRARTPAPKGEVPGNLILCGDDVFSQTVTALTAYTRPKDDEEPDK
jgi:outer membrane protein assembly factor BamB